MSRTVETSGLSDVCAEPSIEQAGRGTQRGLVDLLSERAALGEAGLSAGGLAEDHGAVTAYYYRLGVREDGRDHVASRALDVHEVRVRRLY